MLEFLQRVVGAPLDGDIGQGAGDQRLRAIARRTGCGNLDARHRRGGDKEFLGAEKQVGRRQYGPAAVATQQAVARLRVAPELERRGVHIVVQRQRRTLGQVVEQRRRGFKEQRQVILNAGRRDTGADVLVGGAARRVALEHLAPAAAEAVAPGLIQRKLACRQQAHFLDRVEGALGVDVKSADGLDLVVHQVDAVGQGAAHGEQVHQAAAHAEFTRCDDLADMAVGGEGQLLAQGGQFQRHAFLEEKRVGGEVGRRSKAVQGR